MQGRTLPPNHLPQGRCAKSMVTVSAPYDASNLIHRTNNNGWPPTSNMKQSARIFTYHIVEINA